MARSPIWSRPHPSIASMWCHRRRAARQPTYKGGILGEPFALPSRKPAETETLKTEVPQSQEPLGFHAVEDTNRSSVKDVGVFDKAHPIKGVGQDWVATNSSR